jgi:ribosomal protein S18 acetylase RimI-like enzyme
VVDLATSEDASNTRISVSEDVSIINRLRVEPLERKKPVRAAFTCGETTLDNYIKITAARQQEENLTRVRVGCLDDNNDIICFHALNAHNLNISELDPQFKKRFERYDAIPSVYLSMIGVHVAHQSHGIGRFMLYDAMRQVVRAAEHIGVHFLVLDALNQMAAKLYLRLGFEQLASNPERMIIAMAELA